MVYSTFADYSKRLIGCAVEITFPSNPVIAAISGATAWYANRWGIMNSGEYINVLFCRIAGCTYAMDNDGLYHYACWTARHTVSPLLGPEILPYCNLALSVGCAVATSIALNLLAMAFFKIKACCQSDQREEPKRIGPPPIAANGTNEAPIEVIVEKTEIIFEERSLPHPLPSFERPRELPVVRQRKTTLPHAEENDPYRYFYFWKLCACPSPSLNAPR